MGYRNTLRVALDDGRKKSSSDSHHGSHTITESIGVTCFQNTALHYLTPFLHRFVRGDASVNGRIQSAGSSQCLMLRFVTTPDPRPNQESHVCSIVQYTTYITLSLRRLARHVFSANGRQQSLGSSHYLIVRFVTTPGPRRKVTTTYYKKSAWSTGLIPRI